MMLFDTPSSSIFASMASAPSPLTPEETRSPMSGSAINPPARMRSKPGVASALFSAAPSAAAWLASSSCLSRAASAACSDFNFAALASSSLTVSPMAARSAASASWRSTSCRRSSSCWRSTSSCWRFLSASSRKRSASISRFTWTQISIRARKRRRTMRARWMRWMLLAALRTRWYLRDLLWRMMFFLMVMPAVFLRSNS
mmetsp:Transcript_5100/g.13429  ORF Transcript_5100/g.13429 Transcript_5100/m.13429 type:complete len:200 (-) Transcript_5100:573-1172(-)